jgi:hypothetical protein
MNDDNIIQQLNTVGLIVSNLVKNGKWVSVPTYDKPYQKKGSYIVGLCAVSWKIWHLNESGIIKMQNNNSTDIKKELYKIKIREQDKINIKYIKIKNIYTLYLNNNNKITHDYLSKKEIELHKNVIINNKYLIIPLYHLNNNNTLKISGIQRIYKHYKEDKFVKEFIEDTQLKNSFYHISDYFYNDCELILIAEGYATAYSIYKAFRYDYKVLVLVAFSSTNLLNIVEIFKNKDPIIVLDNDQLIENIKSKYNKCILGSDKFKNDANDYCIKHGSIKLKKFLEEQLWKK